MLNADSFRPWLLFGAKATPTQWLLSLRRSAGLRDLGIAMVASLAVCLPMLSTGQAFFNDWQSHLYLVAKQASYVRQHVVPTYFLNSVELGWFYPFYAFYGGTLYYLVALAAIVLGSAWKAYVGSYALSVAAAFGGWSWLARQAGLRGWPTYLAGCVFVSGAYYLTNAYGRGAWTEFVAVSMLPLILAAAWSLLSSRAWNLAAVVALLVSATVLVGSHIITLVFGSLFLACALIAGLLIRRPWDAAPRGLALVVAIEALALGLNAWFLVPLLRYRDTVRALAPALMWPEFNSNEVLFTLVPTNPWANLTPQLYVQAPIVPLIAATLVLVIGILFAHYWKLITGTGCTLVGLYIVRTLIQNNFDVWGKLPKEALVIQFTYRLNSYLLACIAGLMLLACLYAQRVREGRSRVGVALLGILGAATLVQVGFAEHQVWTARTYGPAEAVVTNLAHLPGTWYDRNYLSSSVPVLQPLVPDRPWVRAFGGLDDISPMCGSGPLAPGGECWVRAEPDSFEATAMRVLIPPHATGEQIKTNIVPSPLITLDPFQLVGQSGDYAVVRSAPSDSPTPLLARAVWTPAIAVGVALTAASALGTISLLSFFGIVRRRKRGQEVRRAPPLQRAPS